MRTTLLRKKGINIYWKNYSSLCSPKVKVNETLSSTTLPLFSSSNKYPDESTQSNYPPPPDPIPNRPLRADSRRPFNPSQRQRPSSSNPTHSTTFRRPGENNENQIECQDSQDFLKRFQLGFDRKDENPNTNPARSDTPASESPPAPPEDSDEIFKKMKETGLIPNAVAMLDGLCKDGLVQEAMKLFGLMREKGTIPAVVIYTAVVQGFCKAHKYDDAVRIFRKMQGNGIIPNAFSYSSLIRGLCQGKRLEDALEFCLEMLEAGHSPNMTTFVDLVDGYCKEKSLEDAQSMIKAVRQKGFILDEKAVREYLDKKGPFLPLVWEAILGKKASQRQSLF
ncbi:pentatricopeptide repeat-containing protein At4g38150-like [Nicotiana tomentosiformis]|uniref:pentatricopeptide repeat-containing protein At4g38150-like n=1 Tax=Nicotiana tomentosiformis TaxID=4098 RepID=UPI00051BE5DF|nr:pentatricopeptide repeat-containing protein At4g38150-like [Nicotiana tomentosiformis]XP_009626850.1 pentatricopeptide repeat-containing protein At4g38150-like [Nicotiana tomentosiformis]